MKKADMLGILIGFAALAIALLSWRASIVLRGARTECPYHLKELYIAYAGFVADHGDSIAAISTNLGGTLEYASDPRAAAAHFQALCRNGLPLASTLCPLDRKRQKAKSIPSLTNRNLSYFLSVTEDDDAAERILAGNRNLASPERLFRFSDRPGVRWDPADGLHGTNGYVLLRDGSVRFVNTDGLLRLGGLPANKSNLVVIP